MGHAWCKEKTSKAQDSKSPLDRVFVRCAHRMYPSLKEEGSVLGGATQRVTRDRVKSVRHFLIRGARRSEIQELHKRQQANLSRIGGDTSIVLDLKCSEIGYAGSPPREVLARGQSIDSVDRPFHPSEWVDVNLEVPNTPRASSVLTNLTADTSLYPGTTPTSSCSNLKDATPVPPPRHKKKNRGRPLPPKPDDIPETHAIGRKSAKDLNGEPLYSSPKLRKSLIEDEHNLQGTGGTSKSASSADASEGSRVDGKRSKEVYEHKVNGTGKVIPSIIVSSRRGSKNSGKNRKQSSRDAKGHHKIHDAEYEKFSKSRGTRDASTPNRSDQEKPKDLRTLITESSEKEERLDVPALCKNYSTISLPSYDELEIVKQVVEKGKNDERTSDPDEVDGVEGDAPKKPARSISTVSLPSEHVVTSLSQKTADRLESYISRCRSFGSLLPHEIIDKLKREGERIDDSSDDDDWGGLDDWDLEMVEHCGEDDGSPSFQPNSRLRERKTPNFKIGNYSPIVTKRMINEADDAADSPSKGISSEGEDEKKTNVTKHPSIAIPRNASCESLKSPSSLKSAMKDEAKRKISMPAKFTEKDKDQKSPTSLEDWLTGERSVRFFEDPSMEEDRRNSFDVNLDKNETQSKERKDFQRSKDDFQESMESSPQRHNFFVENEDFGGIRRSTGSPGPKSDRSSKQLKRALSNESEPFDSYEEKELTMDIQSQSSMSKLSRTISDESLPREMIEDDDFFEEKVAKDVLNRITKDSSDTKSAKTPPPSPEPKIKAEILDNEHSTLMKVLKDEAGGEESNLSSMTPSLTELEAALSDMLEKEDKQEEAEEDAEESKNNLKHSESSKSLDKPLEPKIVPVEKEKNIPSKAEEGDKDLSNSKMNKEAKLSKDNNVPVALGQILESSKKPPDNREDLASSFGKKDEPRLMELDLRNGNSYEHKEPGPTEEKVASRIVDEIFKSPQSDPFGDVMEILEISGRLSPQKMSEEEPTKISRNTTSPFDEPPEKPSRLHKMNLENQPAENEEIAPRPPRRKHRTNSNIRKEDIYTSRAKDYAAIGDPDPYANDRLI